ncbi:hypothetical protein LJC07_08415 [Christensenellaceae bacterium OttesenSCG-928-L17]|nr:hypothetical protein [Christensenellaceae bacterium OttesenSCG-928-L17]
MQKKLSQNLIVAVNAISFTGAAIFGGIGIFAAIANFTKGDWSIYNGSIESLIGTISTSFFLAILALLFGILAKMTIKKISDANILKKAYGTVAVVSGLLTILFIAVAVSIAIFALISIGSKSVDQGTLWLSGFLSSIICAAVTFGTALIAKKVSDGQIKLLPMATNIVLGISSLSALLMLISTIVNVYGNNSSSYYNNDYYDALNGLLDLF